ncbi:MAG: hypothetical protein ABJE95_04650 [Byssovorax sp.]
MKGRTVKQINVAIRAARARRPVTIALGIAGLVFSVIGTYSASAPAEDNKPPPPAQDKKPAPPAAGTPKAPRAPTKKAKPGPESAVVGTGDVTNDPGNGGKVDVPAPTTSGTATPPIPPVGGPQPQNPAVAGAVQPTAIDVQAKLETATRDLDALAIDVARKSTAQTGINDLQTGSAQEAQAQAANVARYVASAKKSMDESRAALHATPPEVAAANTAVEEAKGALTDATTSVANVAAYVAAVRKVCADSCDGAGILCLDVQTGRLFCPGALPPTSLHEGDKLVVRAIDDKNAKPQIDFALSATSVRSTEHLFGGQLPPPAGTKEADGPVEPVAVEYFVRREVEAVASDDTGVADINVALSNALNRSRSYRVPINHGKYYLEVGVLLPLVVDGSRKVTTNPLPWSGERSIVVKEDWHVTPAIVLNVFPFGRRRGHVSAFHDFGCDTFGDLLGFQAGIDLDLSKPFDQFYFGLALEPITGISLNLGTALLQGEFVPENLSTKMILPANATLTPDVKLMPRFYLGVTLTYDVLTTIAGARKAINGIQY